MIPASTPPEIYGLVGILSFVALSLFTIIHDEHLPKALPYLYQAAAIFGLAQMGTVLIHSPIETRTSFNYSYGLIAVFSLYAMLIWMSHKRTSFSTQLKITYTGLIASPITLFFILLSTGHIKPGLLPAPNITLESIPTLIMMSLIILFGGVLVTFKPNPLKALNGLRRGKGVRLNLNRKVQRGETA